MGNSTVWSTDSKFEIFFNEFSNFNSPKSHTNTFYDIAIHYSGIKFDAGLSAGHSPIPLQNDRKLQEPVFNLQYLKKKDYLGAIYFIKFI